MIGMLAQIRASGLHRTLAPEILTVDDLRAALQTALMLEFSTVPTYMTAMCSIKSRCNVEVRQIIAGVIREEMLHMALCCNMLNAIGGHPALNDPRQLPTYPTPLPGDVMPGVIVPLRKCSLAQVRDVFMRIEMPHLTIDEAEDKELVAHPEKLVEPGFLHQIVMNKRILGDICRRCSKVQAQEADLAQDDLEGHFHTIGWYYGRLRRAFMRLRDELQFGQVERQLRVWPGRTGEMIVVTSVESACAAIDLITDQGEGSSLTDPTTGRYIRGTDQLNLAHYFKFEEVVEGARIKLDFCDDEETEVDGYSFDRSRPVPFEPDDVWPMIDNPATVPLPANSQAFWAAARFDDLYTRLLNCMEQMFNGQPSAFDRSLGLMYALELQAETMMALPLPGPLGEQGLNLGPGWRYRSKPGEQSPSLPAPALKLPRAVSTPRPSMSSIPPLPPMPPKPPAMTLPAMHLPPPPCPPTHLHLDGSEHPSHLLRRLATAKRQARGGQASAADAATPAATEQAFVTKQETAAASRPVDLTKVIDLTLLIRPQAEPDDAARAAWISGLPGERTYLSREDYAAQYGATAADLELVAQVMTEFGLKVLASCGGQRCVKVSGTADAVEKAFCVELQQTGDTFTHQGTVAVPKQLDGVVQAVLGLSRYDVVNSAPRTWAAKDAGLYATQVAAAYDFPSDLDGSGQTIGIIIPSGGYRQEGLAPYFAELGLPLPEIVSVGVDGGENSPGTQQLFDSELALDLQVAGAAAPGAKLVVYFMPDNTARSFYDALSAAIHDTEHRPQLISYSGGGMEIPWSEDDAYTCWSLTDMLAVNDLLRNDAAAMGVTFCAAAGDYGSSVSTASGYYSKVTLVDFPASSPWVLSCGGTTLTLDEGNQREEPWNEMAAVSGREMNAVDVESPLGRLIWRQLVTNAGSLSCGGAGSGGVSMAFKVPDYQTEARVPAAANGRQGRGIPDVSGHACNSHGYRVYMPNVTQLDDGTLTFEYVWTTVGGTSAVAPLWAGLLARINQGLGTPVGFVNGLLYRLQLTQGAGVLRPVVDGTNGAYYADPENPWNACTGLGRPFGDKLLAALRGQSATTD